MTLVTLNKNLEKDAGSRRNEHWIERVAQHNCVTGWPRIWQIDEWRGQVTIVIAALPVFLGESYAGGLVIGRIVVSLKTVSKRSSPAIQVS